MIWVYNVYGDFLLAVSYSSSPLSGYMLCVTAVVRYRNVLLNIIVCKTKTQFSIRKAQSASVVFAKWWALCFATAIAKSLLTFAQTQCSYLRFVVDRFITSGEWEIISTSHKVEDVKLACCPFDFSIFTYNIVITRRPQYYMIYLVLPCVVLAALTLVRTLQGFFPQYCLARGSVEPQM